MFGLGPTELIVILVLALLVLGPQRIPEAASSLGKAIRSFRRATRELRDQIDIDDDVRRPFEDLRSALRDEPATLPPPSNPLTSPSETAGIAAAATSPLVQPPAEPVLSQTGDATADQSEAASTKAAAGHAAGAEAATAQVSVGAPVLALATTAQPDSQAGDTSGASQGPGGQAENHR